MAKTQGYDPNRLNILGNGTSVTGDINSEGDIRIDGKLDGNLNTKGKVVIGKSGAIKGEIKCAQAEISGTLEGKIHVEQLLSLKASSRINGDIITSKLAIEPDALFSGTCNMDTPKSSARPLNDKEKK